MIHPPKNKYDENVRVLEIYLEMKKLKKTGLLQKYGVEVVNEYFENSAKDLRQ